MIMRTCRWVGLLAAGALCSTLVLGAGLAEQAGRVVVPFTAGSATDILARTVGQKLTEMWGQQVVVDNRAGAGGTIGAGMVAKAPPDGYTLMVHSAAQAVNPFIYPSLPYDTLKDFVQVAPLAGQPNVLVIGAGHRLQDRRRPRRRREEEARGAQLRLGRHRQRHAHQRREVQARGGNRRRAYPLQGHARSADRHDGRARRVLLLADLGGAASRARRQARGRWASVRPSARARLPNVPTIAESGLPGFDYNLWVAVFAPAGTPADVVEKINRDINQVLREPEIKERMTRARRRGDADDAGGVRPLHAQRDG